MSDQESSLVYNSIDKIINYLVSEGYIDKDLLIYVSDFINSNPYCKRKLEEYILKYPLKENITRYINLVYEDGIKPYIVKNPDKYPYEFVYIIAMGLKYSNKKYIPYNPMSLYEILFSKLGKLDRENIDPIWNNPKIAQIEVRQVLSHQSMRNKEYNYQYYLENDDNSNQYWINIRNKLEYTGYMFPNFTKQEVITIITEIHPYLINKQIRTWTGYAILQVNKNNITYLDTWDRNNAF